MTAHHQRVRAVLLVHGLETERRLDADEGVESIVELAARVARVHRRLDGIRSQAARRRARDRGREADTGATADEWMLAVYDAALAELCAAVGVRHALIDEGVCSEVERLRVELELLPAVPPLP